MNETKTLRALTLHQPYAWAVVAGHKTTENRSFRTSHRGLLLIHTGLSRASLDAELPAGIVPPRGLPFGCIVGAARLVDCVEFDEDHFAEDGWACGPVCWLLRDAVRFARPLPWVGNVGLWRAEVNDALRRQLKAAGITV
jgi:hypothetical protein